MAKFQIMTPGGYEIEVSAASQEEALNIARSDWQTMPRLIARQEGDVRVFERPNGQRYVVTPEYSTTNPDRVDEILANIQSQRPAGEAVSSAIDESLIQQNPALSRLSQYVKGVPFVGSYVDEAIGAIAGPEAATATRSVQGAMERQRPWQTAGLNLAGGATAVLGAAAAAPQAIAGGAQAITGTGRMLPQALRAAGAGLTAGAVEGGVYGAGEGTNAEERVREAGRGAAFGGATGGLLGFASPYARKGIENIVSRFSQNDIRTIAAEFGISQDAARIIKNTFDMGGDVDTAIARVQQAGNEGMIGDAGEAAQALLDATKSSGPAAAQAVSQPLEQRMARTAANLDTGLTQRLGMPAEGPQTAVSEIMSGTREARQRAYDAAYQTPIDYAAPEGQAIEGILGRVQPDILNAAIADANAEMIDRGLRNQQIMAQIAEDGTIVFQEMPNVRQLDFLKRSLDDIARGSKRTEGVVSVDTPASMRANRQASDLRDALINATGGAEGSYAQALKIGGDTIAEREAFLLGERLLSQRTRVEDVLLQLGQNPSQAQIEAAKRGLRTRIDQIVGDVRRIPSDPNIDARQALATLRELSSDNAREKIRRLMGDEANAVFELLDQASVAAETRAATSVNSRTAIRQATQESISQMTEPGVIGSALAGEPVNTTKAIVQAITGQTSEYTEAQKQRIYLDLARALTQARGKDAVTALRVLDAAMKGQQLTDAQTEMLSNLITGALFNVATPISGRGMMPEQNR